MLVQFGQPSRTASVSKHVDDGEGQLLTQSEHFTAHGNGIRWNHPDNARRAARIAPDIQHIIRRDVDDRIRMVPSSPEEARKVRAASTHSKF